MRTSFCAHLLSKALHVLLDLCDTQTRNTTCCNHCMRHLGVVDLSSAQSDAPLAFIDSVGAARLSPAVHPQSACNIVAVQHSPWMPSVGLAIALHSALDRDADMFTDIYHDHSTYERDWREQPRLLFLTSTVHV